jgi:hypothetical protein
MHVLAGAIREPFSSVFPAADPLYQLFFTFMKLPALITLLTWLLLPNPVKSLPADAARDSGGISSQDSSLLAMDSSDTSNNTPLTGHPSAATKSPRQAQSTLTADSIQKAALRDSLERRKNSAVRIHFDFPQSADSLWSSISLYPCHFFEADANGLSQIARTNPQYITIPFTLMSQLNRVLYCGLPAPIVAIHEDGNQSATYSDALRGTDIFSASEIKSATFDKPGACNLILQPSRLTNPETMLFFENGFLDEQTLNLRFARPLTRSIQVGLFSDYHEFDRDRFNHGKGGMYSTYRPIYQSLGFDSSWVSYKGKNHACASISLPAG